MLSMETELKISFPTVMKYKSTETRFVGIFKSPENENIFASFNVPNYPQASGITFETGVTISDSTFQELITKSDNVNFLEFLKLFNVAILNAPKQKIFNRKFFSKFYHEFRMLKHEYPFEKFIFDDKNEIFTVLCTDEYSVVNEIRIKLNFYDENSQMYEVLSHNFPGPKNVKLFHNQYSLLLIHKQFIKCIKDLSAFHDVLQRIDLMCWVISNSSKFDQNYRTIIIGDNNLSVKIIFNPFQMSVIPDFKFFGPSNKIDEYRNKLSENLGSWDSDSDILQNILKVLDLQFFPQKPIETVENSTDILLFDSNVECCICFSFNLNDEIPNIVCDNESCQRHFHNECLYEWLSRLSHRNDINSISGECPNCEQLISCKIPEN